LVKDVENNTERPPRTSVQLFVRSRDIFVGINPTSTTTTKLIATTFVDEQLSNDTFYGIYIHSMHPLSLIYNGIPSELTALALRSNIVHALKYTESTLTADTTLLLHDILISSGEKVNISLNVDVQRSCRQDMSISDTITSKLASPVLCALRINQQTGSQTIKHVVISDMNIQFNARGMNTFFSKTVLYILEKFNGCFESITIRGHSSTIMDLQTLIDLRKKV
jgi:hypothetical protein